MLRPTNPLPPAARLGQQPEDLQVQPDQCDHQAEGTVPLHVLGRPTGYAGLDEIEVEDQIQRRDHNDDPADHDAGCAVPLKERHRDPEEGQAKPDEVIEGDRARRRDDAELEFLAGAVGSRRTSTNVFAFRAGFDVRIKAMAPLSRGCYSCLAPSPEAPDVRSEEHTSELQS